ncbi:hypothetical protein K435DRAFT_865888 [Dendrothele bispora CBS 962.96]|nr:hypothetical protein K435DRAFT_865888 [Dendrothele bispora CBS 962.96]
MGSALSRQPHWSEPRSLPPPYPVNFSTYREVNPLGVNTNQKTNELRQSAPSDITQSTIIGPQQTPIEALALLGVRAREFARVTGHEGYHHLTHAEAINYVQGLVEEGWERLPGPVVTFLQSPMYQEEMRRIYVAAVMNSPVRHPATILEATSPNGVNLFPIPKCD